MEIAVVSLKQIATIYVPVAIQANGGTIICSAVLIARIGLTIGVINVILLIHMPHVEQLVQFVLLPPPFVPITRTGNPEL